MMRRTVLLFVAACDAPTAGTPTPPPAPPSHDIVINAPKTPAHVEGAPVALDALATELCGYLGQQVADAHARLAAGSAHAGTEFSARRSVQWHFGDDDDVTSISLLGSDVVTATVATTIRPDVCAILSHGNGPSAPAHGSMLCSWTDAHRRLDVLQPTAKPFHGHVEYVIGCRPADQGVPPAGG